MSKKKDRAPTWSTLHASVRLRKVDRQYLIYRHPQMADDGLTARERAEADLGTTAGIWLEKLQRDADRWEDDRREASRCAAVEKKRGAADAKVEAARKLLADAEAKRATLEGP